MPARKFTSASSEKIQFSLGSMGFAMGPGTCAAIVRPSSTGTTRVIFAAGDTASTPSWQFQIQSTNRPGLSINGGSARTGNTLTIGSATWFLVAISKQSGNVAPRCHTYQYSTNTWTHENASASVTDSGVPLTRVQIGCTGGSTAFWDGDIAVVGAWNAVLGDSQIEALAYDFSSWFAVQPQGLWVIDQDSTSQLVPDISGGGANQSSITGTSLSTSSVPIFSRGAFMGVAA